MCLFTDKRLLLIPTLFCFFLLVVASFLGSDRAAGISLASPVEILVENCDALWGTSFICSRSLETVAMNVNSSILVEYADSILSFNLQPPVPLVQAIGAPGVSTTPITPIISPSPVVSPTLKPGEPYVHLYGHKTNVTLGEEVILYLSVVNPITSLGKLLVEVSADTDFSDICRYLLLSTASWRVV